MANPLAGQRAAFTRALQGYNATDDEQERLTQAGRMARIIERAPSKGFTRDDVTRNRTVPIEVERLLRGELPNPVSGAEPEADSDTVIAELNGTVDSGSVREIGEGLQAVYAYGYRCAPDRLKIGRSDGDVIGRIAAQINTSTPDKPVLKLLIRTQSSATLERAIHSILVHRGRAVVGGGREWFVTTIDEVCRIFESVDGVGA